MFNASLYHVTTKLIQGRGVFCNYQYYVPDGTILWDCMQVEKSLYDDY